MSVPRFLQSALWSSDIRKLDIKRDRIYIITQILNHGTWKQVTWLLTHYSLRDIRAVLSRPSRGVWQEDVLNYWEIILGCRIPARIRRQALFSLIPQAA